jgi:hypothetical protein
MKAIKQFTLAMALLTTSATLIAQEDNSGDDKPFRMGIGIRGNTVSQNEAKLGVTLPAKLYVNFDIVKYVRVDLQFGFNKNTVKGVFTNNYKMDLIDKSSVFAGGLFGMYKVDKINFYGGFRFGLIKYSNQEAFYIGNSPTPSRTTNKGSVFTTFFTFGGEYFIHSRFSVTPEVGLGIYKNTYEPGNQGFSAPPAKQVNKMMGTEAALIARFYLL